MQTRSLVVSFREIPVDTESAKSGRIASSVVSVCRLVNIGLFVSKDLRRDVEIMFLQGEARDLRIVTFQGMTLRRVSPDERSISIFFAKAAALANELDRHEYVTMDNGIIVRRCPLGTPLVEWSHRTLYLASRRIRWPHVITAPDPNGVFVYDYAETLTPTIEELSPQLLPMNRTPERFVLEVNRRFDLEKDEPSRKAS